ncbi:hypothetical protein L6164_003762 [Bauhinia variegata]|uniref:Uncharacterized protein n=1 Tax=Bauhinia variegata TaxID=167791 RepID=A0ACB9Q2B7_BAUVA|nr:hypothetical protein L6164_003762 [Bauhinia variegata]
MADTNQQSQELQPVLVLGPPLIFQQLESQCSHKYTFLKAFATSLPIDQFLVTHHVDPSSILCNPLQEVNAEVLCLLPSLGIVVTASVSTDHIDLTECHRRRVQVATVGGLYTEDVADLGMGLFIDVLRKISTGDQYVGGKRIENEPNVPEELFALDNNLLLSPHTAAMSLEGTRDIVARNLEAFFSSKPLVSPIIMDA